MPPSLTGICSNSLLGTCDAMQQLREHQAGEDDEVAQVLDQRLEAARGQPPARLLIDDRPAHIHAGQSFDVATANSPYSANILLAVNGYGRGCTIVLGDFINEADLAGRAVAPTTCTQHLDAGDGCAIFTDVARRHRSIQEPVGGTYTIRAILRPMNAIRYREWSLGQILRLFGVEHALIEDRCSAGDAVNSVHRRVVVVAYPDRRRVVHRVADRPVILEVLAGTSLGSSGPGVAR